VVRVVCAPDSKAGADYGASTQGRGTAVIPKKTEELEKELGELRGRAEELYCDVLALYGPSHVVRGIHR
jgi:hypothetical protein